MSPALHPADQRLLDAALHQAFATAGPAAKQVTNAPTPPRARRWLAAALLLLGIAVPTVLAWQLRDARHDSTQDPEHLPPQLPAEVRADEDSLEKLPADTVNLHLSLVEPAALAQLRRFRGLRRLVLSPERVSVGPVRTKSYHRHWGSPPNDLLQPLTDLPLLESVELGWQIAVPPDLLRALAACPSLRELHLRHGELRIDEVTAAALRPLPQLRGLHLYGVPVDAAAMRRLTELSLTALGLMHCPDFDDDAWRVLTGMASLQRLSFADWGWRELGAPADTRALWRPDAERLAALASMPALTALEFDGCDLHDEELAVLPPTLRELRLRSHELTGAAFTQLARLRRLRALDISTQRRAVTLADRITTPPDAAAAARAVAEAIAGLQLEHVRYTGLVTPTLLDALAAQTNLVSLTLTSDRIAGLSRLQDLPKLVDLHLFELGSPGGLVLDEIEHLTRCKALADLELYGGSFDADAARALFGERVRVAVRKH